MGAILKPLSMSIFLSKVLDCTFSFRICQFEKKWKWPYFVLHSAIGPEPKPKLKGDNRTYRVWLDPNQYQQDMTSSIQSGTEDPYETFNIIMRRKPKENNFKVCIPRGTSDQLSLYIVFECFIFRPWAPVPQHNPSLMYCTNYALLGIEAVRLGPGQL